jgi:hypothetical protein
MSDFVLVVLMVESKILSFHKEIVKGQKLQIM